MLIYKLSCLPCYIDMPCKSGSFLMCTGQLYLTIQNSGNVTGRFTTLANKCCTSPYGYNGTAPSCGNSSAMASIGGPVVVLLAPGAQALVTFNISARFPLLIKNNNTASRSCLPLSRARGVQLEEKHFHTCIVLHAHSHGLTQLMNLRAQNLSMPL